MKRLMISLVVVLALFISVSLCTAEDEKFCNDEKMWAHFDSMAKEFPADNSVQILHALKIGLCEKIEQGSIRTALAIRIFNDMVDTAVKMSDDGKENADNS